jgi:formylglycine-generating enzyme required for sulfatase activity
MIRRGTPRMLKATYFLSVLCLAALLLSLLPAQAQKGGAPKPPTGNLGADKREPADPATEIEKLKEEIRRLKAELAEQRRQTTAIVNHLTWTPEVDVQQEDYAEARSRFRTKLLRQGPAPQAWAPVNPPAEVTEIDYSSGELRLKAWVNRPADESRQYPAVLYLHGGNAFSRGAWDDAKPYRDAGFVVMTPILRAENGQPGAWSYFYDEVDDVLAAAEYLSKQPYIDASHLFLAGHSNGGTLTLLAAMASRRFRAAASFDGAPYKPEFFTRLKFMPYDTSDPRESRLRSPMAYASSFKCPVRVYIAQKGKDSVHLASLRTAGLAKRRGLDVEAVEIEGDHVTHVPAAMRQSIVFFQKNSARDITAWNGAITPLPKTAELELGNGVKLKVARIEPGKFQMGAPPSEEGRRGDESRHEVEITRPYIIGVYEVTQAQYRQVMGASPSIFSAIGSNRERVAGLNTDDFPVEGNVSWEDAMDFCRIVSSLPGVRDKGWVVDLPTEAEWEYAARAGTQTAFPNGDALSSEQENFNGDNPYGAAAKGPRLRRPTTVGSYAPNAWGLYDMLGNVQEWCKDWYDKDYQPGDQGDKLNRVIRGGAWNSSARDCRVAHRRAEDPARSDVATGFRVVVRLREK